MASNQGARVEGVEAAQRAYGAIADDARNMTDAHERIARAGAEAARARAPVGATGRLAATIDGRATESDAQLVVGVPYWPFREFGTRYVAARRFMRAGIDAMTQAAPSAYRERMAAIIDRRTR